MGWWRRGRAVVLSLAASLGWAAEPDGGAPAPATAEERKFLDQTLAKYGSAWAGGLKALERDFEVRVTRKGDSLELGLISRAPDKLTWTYTVRRKDGQLSGCLPNLPDGPEASPDDLALVDAALRRLETLWVMSGAGDELLVLPLDRGLDGLRRDQRLRTRKLGDVVALYLDKPDPDFGPDSTFCVSFFVTPPTAATARHAELRSARRAELPDIGSRWLDPGTVDFLDQALKRHGDFRAYGNVTAGLRALAKEPNLRLSLREDARQYHVGVTPKDGHGHFLRFAVDKKSGRIDGTRAGHLMTIQPRGE